MEKRIPIKKSSRFRTLNLPVAWLEVVKPRNGDTLVITQDGDKLVLVVEKKQ